LQHQQIADNQTMKAATVLTRPRTKPAEIRREELMDAAQALFLGKGFGATSVDEIVRAADVAKGTFYFYFKTKDDVLQALRSRFVEGFHGRLEDAVDAKASDDWVGRLDAWLEAGVNGYLDEFELHDLVFHEFRPSNRRMKHDNPVIAHLTKLIAGGGKAGAWTVRDPRLTAVMLFNALHGAVDDEIVSPIKAARKRLVADVRVFCRLALGLTAK
jgi:AcrR family transcriptional regulator